MFEKKVVSQLRKLKKRIAAKTMILFGSYATGKHHKFSDIDVLIIKDTKKKFFNRIGEVLNNYDGDKPLEPLVYTPKEFEKMKSDNPFIRRILKEGLQI